MSPGNLKQTLRDVHYISKTGATTRTLYNYIASRFSKAPKAFALYSESASSYQTGFRSLELSTDWFSKHIPIWLYVLERWEHAYPQPRRGLEVGSWEGRSAHFILSRIGSLHLTCVDTFQGADEHRDGRSEESASLGFIEERFDKNLEKFALTGRLSKVKTQSLSYLATCKDRFDFVYIDGSHHARDVVCDALLAWKRLNSGGLMILDDYLWKYYPRETNNPASAINYFLRLIEDESEIFFIWEQTFVLKRRKGETD